MFPRDKGGNSSESEDGASLGFYPWLPLINRSNTKKKGIFSGCFGSLLIPFVLAKPPSLLEIGTILSPWLGRFPLNRGLVRM